MWNRIQAFFSPPTFPADEDRTRTAWFINVLILSTVPLLVMSQILGLIFGISTLFDPGFYIIAGLSITFSIIWGIMRAGQVILAAYLHIIVAFTGATVSTLTNGVGTQTYASYFIVILISGLLLGLRSVTIFTIASGITVAVLAQSQTIALEAFVVFTFSGVFLWLIISSLQNAVNRARANAADAQHSNQQLLELRDALERRVQERAAALGKRASQLQTISELAQAILQVQNPNEIFSAAVKLISEQFGFYHVGIFLIDRDREFVILQSANTAGGQKMLARGHRLMLGTGVVGFAAQMGKPRIALDVGTDAVFFNNPDLPDTRSEIALPMIASGQTIGVLDVQSTEPGAFTEEDFRALGTLANQMAIAIENARLLTEARASAKQVQEVFNDFVRIEWSRTTARNEQVGFRYNGGRIELLDTPLEHPEIASAVLTGNVVARHANGKDELQTTAAVPVKLRGEVIGILHIESNDPNRRWRDDELSLMEAVAERAAFAMENARLYQDARRRAAKERMIAEATSSISGSLNVENILQATAVELERVLGGSEVLIKFSDKDFS
jgi:GAF domain-containing protein